MRDGAARDDGKAMARGAAAMVAACACACAWAGVWASGCGCGRVGITGDGEADGDGDDGTDVAADDGAGEPDGGDDAGGEEAVAPSCARYVDVDSAAGEPDGMAWVSAFTRVQDGIDAAAAAASEGSPCDVWVGEGTYHVYEDGVDDTILLAPFVRLLGGFAGVEASEAERDWVGNATILDGRLGPGETAGVYHVVTGSDHAEIDGFTITGGRASATTGTALDMAGAGMINFGCSPVVRNCTFEGNEAMASMGKGAAMANIEGASPRIERCTFRGNSTGGGGGAIVSQAGSSPVIVECTFEGNSAEEGGAVYVFRDSVPRFERCRFEGNEATGWGGAVALGNATPVFVSCAFVGNTAGDAGGAAYVNIGTPMFMGCTFAANVAESRGGGAVCSSGGAVVSVANSILWQDTPNELDVLDGGSFLITRCAVTTFLGGDGSIEADPMLADVEAGDMHLLEGSPCIDAAWWGTGAAPLDYEGNGRVDDPSVEDTGTGDPPYADIGALEHAP